MDALLGGDLWCDWRQHLFLVTRFLKLLLNRYITCYTFLTEWDLCFLLLFGLFMVHITMVDTDLLTVYLAEFWKPFRSNSPLSYVLHLFMQSRVASEWRFFQNSLLLNTSERDIGWCTLLLFLSNLIDFTILIISYSRLEGAEWVDGKLWVELNFCSLILSLLLKVNFFLLHL